MKKFETRRVERASYGAFFFGQNVIYFLMLQFLNLFYTDVVGIAAGAVGIMFFVARTWDAVNDPILGSIIDRADFKGGKFLPWIKMVNFALPLMTVLLFINPQWGDRGNLLYAYATYIVWGMIYTLCDVPIFALSTAMSKNSNERVILLTWGRVAALLAGAIIAGMGMPFIESMGWTPAAITLAVIAMVSMIPIRFFAIERVQRIDQAHPSTRETLQYLRSHRPMIVLYMALLAAFATNTALVATNYFAIYNLGGGETTLVAPLLLSQLAPMFVLVFMLPWLIRRFGKRQIYIWGSILGAVFGLVQYFIGYENITLVIILNMFKSTGMFLPLLLLGMFSADFVEYGQHHQGRRLEGIAFSIQTFATKFTQAIAVGIGGLLLSFYGYVPNVEQSEDTLEGIFALYTLFPAFGALASAWIMYQFYDLKEADVQNMIDGSGSHRLTIDQGN